MTDSGSRERLVRAASELFQRKGYTGTSLSEILEASGSPRGSLYYYFPGGKEALGAAAVRFAAGAILERVHDGLDAGDDAAQAVDRVITGMASALRREGGLRDVSLGVVALETAASVPALRAVCAQAFRSIEEAYASRFAAAGIPGSRASALAVTVQAMVEGGIMLAVTQGTPEVLDDVAGRAAALVRLELRGSSSSGPE